MPETREAFTRRAEESAQAQAGGDRRLSHLEEHGNSLIAYREKTADETTAPGRAVLWLRKNGIDAVLTDGMFESNRKGRTTRHPEAATSPDGKVFISSDATLSEAELSRHEAVHVLEAKNSPLFYDFYEDLQSRVLRTSEYYQALAKEINKEYYNGSLDIHSPDSLIPIYRELFAYVHQFIQTDPVWASERFSGAFSDWGGVVEASGRLAQGLENQGAAGDAQGYGNPSRTEPAEVRGEFSRLYAPDSGTSERLQAMAAGYDADTAEAFAAGYDGTLPLTSYQTAFDYFRTQAKQGIPLETAEKNGGLLGQLLAPESRRIAYQAGLRESAGRGNIKMDAERLEEESGNFKFSEKSESQIQKIIKTYRERSPVEIPESAVARARTMKDGYEQISYKWKDKGFKYEARWHTRTSGAPESQGNTWVIQRTRPGNGEIKPYSEFLVGDNEWIPGHKWYDAIAARKAGNATPDQEAILDKGHWKE